MSREDIKQHIIESAIECIEEHGVQSVTVRDITQRAGVNTASINYYFGSKDELIRQALEQTLENLFVDWEDMLQEPDADLHEVFRFMLKEILSGARRYPNITKAHLYDPLINNQYDGMFVRRLNSFLGKLAHFIHQQKDDGSLEAIHKNLITIFSSAMFPALMPALFEGFSGYNFHSDDQQDEYIEYLLEKVI